MTKARVLTFHVDMQDMPGVIDALDGAAERLFRVPTFSGLLCLESEGLRHQVTVITLWGAEGLEATEEETEVARRTIAASTDLGVMNEVQTVIRYIPGPRAEQRVTPPALFALANVQDRA